MGHPHFAPPPVPPQRSGADIAISIVVLVLTALLGVVAAFLGLFSLAFLDHCPPPRCSVDGAVNAVFTTLFAGAVVGVAGMVVTIIALVRRNAAWPFAIGTFTLCILTLGAGVVGYSAAIG
ncbi:hypothetical protein [Mycolicibacterium parafortuitum]|uniref:Uncharacterized protein n=1 Tax=Mycolicibacterium parafortuitum TaxID=39692 RepID=A0A375YMD7_MYCPF|nr:hypothetical protein [Mycolicibacterium parafortuitum]ORB23579.1 hypothetical protein BST38_28655 [Mycolicibacterium parafortuitum]SRX82209.1 hypothetical protein MPP7335_03969 [Mycolicibacterium parafortuitum]